IDGLGHRYEIVESQDVRHQVVVLDEFALFIPDILGDQVVGAKRDPLHELVEPLTFVSGGEYCPSKLDFRHVAQQEYRTDYAAQFSKGEVQLVLARVAAQAP